MVTEPTDALAKPFVCKSIDDHLLGWRIATSQCAACKAFRKSISQNYREESLPQIILDAYNYSNDASQAENKNPHFLYQDAQILGVQKVVPCPNIKWAHGSPCSEHDDHQWWNPGTVSFTSILFGTPDIQKASESGKATDARGDAQDVPLDEDRASDKDGDEYTAAESEDEIV